MARRLLFIINPAAGGGRGTVQWREFENRFLKHGVSSRARPPAGAHAGEAPALLESVFTTAPGEAKRIAADAAGDHDVLVAVGGDGTAREVAQGILTAPGCRAGLAIVPCGTGNDVALSAGVRNLDEAWTAVAQGQSKRIDVIRVECTAGSRPELHYALSFAGVGIIGPLLRMSTPFTKKLLGRALSYKFALLRALWSYKPPEMHVSCDGDVFNGRFLFLGVSNCENAGGGMRLAPGARMDDGMLDVNLVGAVGRADALSQLGRLARGRHTAHPKVRYFQSRVISVKTDAMLEVAVDGDLAGYAPARFEVQPRALAVFVNA